VHRDLAARNVLGKSLTTYTRLLLFDALLCPVTSEFETLPLTNDVHVLWNSIRNCNCNPCLLRR